ncbi:MAG: SPOR domain-containing protein, partial [Holophaga sp.]|nr:SPOR domain-containing protein [Holophaga sp.]
PAGPAAAPAPTPAPAPAPPAETRVPPPPKPEAPPKSDPSVRWTLQLISTPDPQEAQRMVAKARASGFPAVTVTDKGLYKVRLAQPAARESIDATALKLKNRGFKPFAMKVE